MKKLNFIFLVLISIFIFSCVEKQIIDEDIPKGDDVISNPKFEPTGFPIDIFKTIVNQEDKPNIILSPLSIESAFYMAANGAVGETRKNILDILGQTDDIDAINSNYKSLKTSLDCQSDTTSFKMVNSIFWDDTRMDVNSKFLEALSQYYDADEQNLDFGDEKTLDIINQWCSDNTEERIKKILSIIQDNDVLFLINALYFIGDWKYPFPLDYTKDGIFTKSDGTKIEIPFMNSLAKSFRATINDDFQAVDLPFANTDFSMTFIMPKKEKINDFINGFGFDELEDLYESKLSLSPELKISLPKFELEYKIELSKALIAMGMNIPFDGSQADFSNLGSANAPFFIGQALHKTFLKVDEKGAEGAAVTLIQITTGESSLGMTFDKPFMIVLKNHKTDSYLFMAKIGEPKIGE